MDRKLLTKMMQEAQKLQQKTQKELAALEEKTFEETIGSNYVKIEATGNLEIQKITINPELLEDQATLEDLIVEVTNKVINKIKNEKQKIEEQMNKLSSGMF